MLGIGIITYNRLPCLQDAVHRVRRLTRSPYRLVVADDGSTDGTRDWVLGQRLPLLPGPWVLNQGMSEGSLNRGIAWNKNRALYYFMSQTDCDPILILEDDCHPLVPGWERRWVLAGRRWQHMNVIRDWLLGWPLLAGEGSVELPYHLVFCTGQCTVTSRFGLGFVGYLDSRFKGYGWEHVEWTKRFGLAGFYSGRYFLAIRGGVEFVDLAAPALVGGLGKPVVPTWEEPKQNTENYLLMVRLLEGVRLGGEVIHRDPWRDEEERRIMVSEVSCGRQV